MSSYQKKVRRSKECFIRYPKLSYATIQDGLARVLVSKGVGRNGWAVMAALCRAVYYDGRMRAVSAESISAAYGLTKAQVARGMSELRDKGIIEPVTVTTSRGYRYPDRSNFGHVAQYRFTKATWEAIETIEPEDDSSDSDYR